MTQDLSSPLAIDFKRLSETLGVEEEAVLISFLDLFLEEFPKLSANLKCALEARDATATHHAAHAAKGAAANVAAPNLTVLLKYVQDEAHLKNWPDLEAVFDKISQEHDKVIAFRMATQI